MPRTLSRVVCLLVLSLAATMVSAQNSDADSQNAPPDDQAPAAAPAPTPAPAPAPAPSPRIQNPRAPNQIEAPDMVCFGYYPRWTVQFSNGKARYLADNQSPQTFKGDFVWVPDENAWDWHLANGVKTAPGNYGLSAAVEKASCHDITLNENFPFSASVYVPRGDMVSGCCRKMKPGEGEPKPMPAPAMPAGQNQ